MKKFFVYAISLIILLALNMAFPAVRGAAPNFLLLLVIFCALQRDDDYFLFIAFSAGILLDIFSGAAFGAYAVSFLIIAFLINYTTSTFLTSDLSFELTSAIIAAAYISFVILFYAVNFLEFKLHTGNFALSATYLAQKIWLDLVLNLIFAVPVYYLVTFNDRIIMKGAQQNR